MRLSDGRVESRYGLLSIAWITMGYRRCEGPVRGIGPGERLSRIACMADDEVDGARDGVDVARWLGDGRGGDGSGYEKTKCRRRYGSRVLIRMYCSAGVGQLLRKT